MTALLSAILMLGLVGAPAPELPTGARTLDGAPVTLTALRGRVVLVHFWTFGCGNCRNMLPRYGEWAERYGGRGLSVVGVHTPELAYERDRDAVARFVREQKIRWPVVVDADYEIWRRFSVAAWPTVVLVDRSGVVRGVFVGDDKAPAIDAKLQELLISR